MNILSILDKIYENKNFTTIILIALIVLVILFIVVFFLGLKDANKDKKPKKKKKNEDAKDITFEKIKIEDCEKVKEDVTFEVPVLTEELDSFKKSLEEEMASSTTKDMIDSKPLKILDIDELEDTVSIKTTKKRGK